jgi:4-phytase/acid phosphatase
VGAGLSAVTRKWILAAALLLAAGNAGAANPELKYVVIVSRHGVRSPTWDAARLNRYSARPWPDWGVAPGELTPHGRDLILILGRYYRDWLVGQGLLGAAGCRDAGRVFVHADAEQRTLETGRAFAESILPGCGVALHSHPGGHDPLFSGVGAADPRLSLQAVGARLGSDARKLLVEHREAVDTLQFLLTGGQPAPLKLLDPPAEIGVEIAGKSVEMKGPFAAGSTLSEVFLLEYANGFRAPDLAWGRLTKENLYRAMELHKVYADLMRRTPYLARARGSNLLAHVARSLEQAASGSAVPGALGRPGDALLLLAGHDTNLSNLSGMLDLSWRLPGYQADDTPPGGALIFSLWRSSSGHLSVRTEYLAETLDQMRNADRLTLKDPPASQEVRIPGCVAADREPGCSWTDFRRIVNKAIDPAFTSADDSSGGEVR